MPKRKWIFIAIVSTALLWTGLFGLAKLVQKSLNDNRPANTAVPAVLGNYWTAPAFSFPDQDRQIVTDQSLRGHVWIADFFFSQCTSACPILTSKLMLLQRQIASPGVRFVSFSVDPEHDSPEALKKYAELWQGDQSRWKLLSTNPDGLGKVVSGMKVTVAPSGDKDNPILHSTMFMLVDQTGQVRGLYDSNDSDALARLVVDTKSLDGQSDDATVMSPATLPTASELAGDPSITRGGKLYGAMGCLACHSQPRVAPPLQSLFGSQVRLEDKRMVWADEGYLHESIVDPYAKIVAGYTRSMPSYQRYLDDSQVQDLVNYIKSISTNSPGGHGIVSASAATPTTASTQAELLIDPVCKMEVTSDPSAPHTTYKGVTYFFCADHCRESFLKNPEKYIKRKP